jgi:hypothetical protein
LRYCARPPVGIDRLRQQGADLVYRCDKQHSEPIAGVGARQAELVSVSVSVSVKVLEIFV